MENEYEDSKTIDRMRYENKNKRNGVLRRLYVGMNRNGELAERELRKRSIEYVVIKSDDEKMEPVLVVAEGYFEGLEKIKEYAKYWVTVPEYDTRTYDSHKIQATSQ